LNWVDYLDINKELLKGHIDLLILSLLNSKDMYGYEIAKKIRLISDDSFELKEGTLYLSLKRLEKNQFISSYWGNEKSAGGRRKYYKMNILGNQNLKLKIKEWFFMRDIIDSCLNISVVIKEDINVLD